jgi:Ca2+-binding EF-hand superfamily protein
MIEMFKHNDIDIQREQIVRLFNMVDTDMSGSLDIGEFLRFSLNDDINRSKSRCSPPSL